MNGRRGKPLRLSFRKIIFMADTANDPRPADTDNKLLQKILNRLTTISGGGGGSGGLTNTELRASAVAVSAASLPLPSGASTEATLAALSAKVTAVNTGAVVLAAGAAAIGSVSVTGSVTVTGPLTDTQLRASAVPVSGPLTDAQIRATALPVSGPLTDTQLRATAVPVSGPLTDTQLRASAVPISVAALPLPSGAATEATLSTLNGKVTAVNTGAVTISAALPAGTNAVGLVGGKTASIKDTTVVSTSPAYTAGDAVGAKRTIANALTAVGTGILESIQLMDRANQSLGLVIYIFDADPTNATITDNAAFVFSTDDLKVLATIVVGAGDWTVTNTKAFCLKNNLGVVLKSAGTSLYVAVVATTTPTFAATTDLQLIFGILQD
jgi:hypothetical protein